MDNNDWLAPFMAAQKRRWRWAERAFGPTIATINRDSKEVVAEFFRRNPLPPVEEVVEKAVADARQFQMDLDEYVRAVVRDEMEKR